MFARAVRDASESAEEREPLQDLMIPIPFPITFGVRRHSSHISISETRSRHGTRVPGSTRYDPTP
eukprot:3222647-Prymnesium_polylepis.1